jgi:hypothetical protein
MRTRADPDVFVPGALLVHAVRLRIAENLAAELRERSPDWLAAEPGAIGVYAFLCEYTRPIE